MTQEEKQLLLKELCARLPYGVKAKVYGWDEDKGEVEVPLKIYSINTDGYVYFETNDYNVDYLYIDDCPLYLRPMSSMTEEEMEELKKEHLKDEKLFAECLTKVVNGDNSMRGKVITHFAADWCNKNHFDYRGLIPMGLALEATEEMYKID